MGLEEINDRLIIELFKKNSGEENLDIFTSDPSILSLKKSIKSLKPNLNMNGIFLPGKYLFFSQQSLNYSYDKNLNQLEFERMNYYEPACISNLDKTQYLFVQLSIFFIENSPQLLLPRKSSYLNNLKYNENEENCGIILENPVFITKNSQKEIPMLMGFSNNYELENTSAVINSERFKLN